MIGERTEVVLSSVGVYATLPHMRLESVFIGHIHITQHTCTQVSQGYGLHGTGYGLKPTPPTVEIEVNWASTKRH